MKVQVSRSKNACSYYITKGFRDPKTGRPTTKVVEKLGIEAAIRAKIGPDADIMEWCRAHAEELEEQGSRFAQFGSPRKNSGQPIRGWPACLWWALQDLNL